MSVLGIRIVESPNLSLAWGQLLVTVFDANSTTLAPIVVSIAGFERETPAEDTTIRNSVDSLLRQHRNMNSIRVTAMTIFPWEIWQRRGRQDCKTFSRLCVDRLVPRMKARDRRNQYGVYFERMMDARGERGGIIRRVNQLEHVINLMKHRRMPRRSALQVACFDPAKDHTGQPVRGFPCLQQVSMSHNGKDEFALNAYYPTQYVFDRAYGNYLGLCHLGAFIAHHVRMRFVRLNCFIGRPELGVIGKRAVRPIVSAIRGLLGTGSQQEIRTS